jgi:hypothetical protein
MIAPSGSGKTNALLKLIFDDLQKVAEGKASVIVMDSSGTAPGRLLHYLTRSRYVHTHLGVDRLAIIEPSTDHPLALNLFDVDMDRISKLSGDDRTMALSSARAMINYVLGGLLGSETTDKQRTALGYLLEAILHIPDATIFTLAELLTNEGYEKYREHILKLDSYTVDFFENRFRQRFIQRGTQQQAVKNSFAGTKEELFWRIDKVLADPNFRRMFSHPRNLLNMFDEMQAGKLIVINTHRSLLQEHGMETFGRLMIAKIYQAAERRLQVGHTENLPVYIYIDECHDYIANEPRIVRLLDQLARKNNLAFMFAHQRPANLSGEVLDAVSTTAIRFASRNEQDVRTIAQRLRVDDPDVITRLGQGEFAYFFRLRRGERKGVMEFPHFDDKIELVSEDLYRQVRQIMQARYSREPVPVPPMTPPLEASDEESTRGDPNFE